jgi:MazG family protein
VSGPKPSRLKGKRADARRGSQTQRGRGARQGERGNKRANPKNRTLGDDGYGTQVPTRSAGMPRLSAGIPRLGAGRTGSRSAGRTGSRSAGRTGTRRKGDARARKRIGKAFEALVALQARLRAPNGCPWDREQTHDSLRTYLVEETYEVLDAIEGGDARKFADELGDLLLQIVFHAQLASEDGRFDIADVIEQIYTKMVRRHPHVFGNVRAKSSAQVLKNWEQLKAEERAKNEKPTKAAASILDPVPRSLPGLVEAHQLTRRAANVGFDWPEVEGIFDKLAEETAELKESLASGDRGSEKVEEEVGDLLFVGVNLARFLGLDAEIALKKANGKFAERFRAMERMAAARGQKLGGLSAAELDALWNEAKSIGAEEASR